MTVDSDTVDQLGLQLVRLVKLAHHAGAQFHASRDDGVETAAYRLLACLVIEGPRRNTALAERVRSDSSTVSRQVSALVQHGLVERRSDPADGRACLLAATPEGTEAFQEHRRERNRRVAEVVGHWPEHDQRLLVDLLTRFNTDVEAATRTPPHVRAQGDLR
jgi:DNA-binding MarR family transcriptional regulator